MNDLISRQAAIETIFNEPLYESGMKEKTAIEVVLAIYEKIKSLPSSKPERKTGEWIPCSERLPEKSGRYLVTNTRLGAFEVTWNIFYNGKGEAPEGWLYEDGTIAWMPLPEPYKGEE